MKVKLLIVLALVCSTVMFARTAIGYTDQARDFLAEGCYTEAEEIIDLAINESPKKMQNYLIKYEILFAQSKMAEAYKALEFYVNNNLGADKDYYCQLLSQLEDGIINNKKGKQFYTIGTLPNYLNSPNSDFAGVLNNDGTEMYFTSSRKAPMFKENILKSEKVSGVWGKPQLVKEFCTDNHESLNSISQTGDTVYLFGNFDNNKNKHGDIYKASKVRSSWTKPMKIKEVSSKWSDQQPYVFNDEVMFFTSNRQGSIGGYDIWVSEFDGGWSTPVNLGSVINTIADEQTPFIDWDGETLYFSSNGHPSFGGFDIFKAKKRGDSWTDWSEPVNLGIDINSIYNDRHFYRVANSNEIYLSSDRKPNSGYEDIYKVYMTYVEEADLVIGGYVKDTDGNPVSTMVQWKYTLDGQEQTNIVSSASDGYYSVSFPTVESLECLVADKSFLTYTETIVVDPDVDKMYHDIVIEPLKQQSYVISNIFFDFDSANLREESYPSLDDVASKFLANPNFRACIVGYTDDLGSDEYNKDLSEKRAKSVYEYLTSKGIENDRLSFRGDGENNPKVANDSEENRQLNRRVEFDLQIMGMNKVEEAPEVMEEVSSQQATAVEDQVEVNNDLDQVMADENIPEQAKEMIVKVIENADEAEVKVIKIDTAEVSEAKDVEVEVIVDSEQITTVEDAVKVEEVTSFFNDTEEKVISNKIRRLARKQNETGTININLINDNDTVKTLDILRDGQMVSSKFASEIKNVLDGWKLEKGLGQAYILTVDLD